MMEIPSVFRKRRPHRYRSGWYCKRPSRRPRLPAVSRKTWAWAIVGVMTCGVMVLFGHIAFQGLCRTDFFRLTGITINGCHHLDKEQVLEQSGLDNHTNLLAMRPEDIIRRLTAHPWIDQATVTRNWPDEVAIRIRERQPVAMINLKEGLCYLDKELAVIGPVAATDDIDFPVITGLEDLSAPLDKEAAWSAALADALALINQAGRGNSYLPSQNISEIHVSQEGELVLYLLDQVFPIYLGHEDMKDKYWRLAKILKGLYKSREIFRIDHIQMDYLQDKVLVSMSESGANTRS
jgi:cell division septal protein FtsQ